MERRHFRRNKETEGEEEEEVEVDVEEVEEEEEVEEAIFSSVFHSSEREDRRLFGAEAISPPAIS